MLLRRVIKHVKAQNWTAVGLDFAIVVLGILVAVWIDGWSDEQANKKALKASLQSLRTETVANLNSLDIYVARHTSVIDAGKSLFSLADEPSLQDVPYEMLGKVFVSGWTTDYSTGALTSLISSERLDSIDNRELKLAIASLPRMYTDAFEDEHLVIEMIDAQWVPYISQFVSIRALSEFEADEIEKLPNAEAIDAPGMLTLLNSLEFQNHVHYRLVYQRLILREIDGLRASLEETLDLIERELGSDV